MTVPKKNAPSLRPANSLVIAQAACVLAAGLGMALSIGFPPDGHERGPLLQLAGRLHPLVVHFPLGLLAIVPVLEILGSRPCWASLRDAAGFILSAGVFTTFVGISTGWLLAYAGGESLVRVAPHLRGALALGIVSSLAWWALCRWQRAQFSTSGQVYPCNLVVTLGLLAYTGHEGGSLTHGSTYLTAHLPTWARTMLGETTAPAAPPPTGGTSIFAAHIQPIFDAHCTKCHGRDEAEGKLRLDSFAALLAGGGAAPWLCAATPLRASFTAG